jgi:hypothetical protein
MKDPLAYFLQEGFGNIYSFPAANGTMQAHFRWASQYKEFVPLIVTNNRDSYITMQGITYFVNDAFFAKYTVFVDSEEEALKLIAEKNAEWEEMMKEGINIQS